jgi:glyoxylase-like metal-dependent hydrolase (beta-lactamase superfamily II)/outer membrane protein assembly factor BamB
VSVAHAAEPDAAPKVVSRVPAWDVRGSGLLPLQGVACLDVSADGSRIVVGTIALPGDFNVHTLDFDGTVLRSSKVGQRWIGQVAAAPGDQAFALCTMVSGSAFDEPQTFLAGDTSRPVVGGDGGLLLFHYGDHSNHTGKQVRGWRNGVVTINENQILWLNTTENGTPEKAATPTARALFRNLKATSLAVHPGGVTIVGGYSEPAVSRPPDTLFAFAPDGKLLWSRREASDVGASERPEPGEYGQPRLPDGTRNPLLQRDEMVTAPLSLAVAPDAEFSTSTRVASVDYRGWQRTIRSSATLKDEVYGIRFQPAKPTITVCDGSKSGGATVARFGPEKFAHPGWLDIEFLPGGEQLLAYPHRWACRGLAGQPFLPADDQASMLYLLDVKSGEVRSRTFPDAISSVAVASDGAVAVSCWDGRVYRLGAKTLVEGELPKGVDIEGPSIVRFGAEGRLVAAKGTGEIVLLSAADEIRKRIDLNTAIPRPEKPWVKNANATPLAKGLWQNGGGRVESDLGGQTVIEAPDGLILIDPHAGLSFESEWRAMEVAGLDPKRVKYVLATHEHGDHAPGASLWRVATGAQFVCSRQMAYTLQHHLPQGTGYGLHAPVKADIAIDEDTTLDLAGLKVTALRLPGHTYGAMGWLFERDGQRFVSIGDLIMPEGRLGYSGSVNFSPYDVLESLRRLDDLKVDKILPGHGPVVGPDKYVKAGIAIGTRVGWGKMKPERPDPRFAITQPNVLVTGFLAQATSAAFGDVDGDGLPDVAVVTPNGEGSLVKVFLNQKERADRFDPMKADFEVKVPTVASPTKVRVLSLNDDKRMDLFVSGQGTVATLASREKPGEYDIQTSSSSEVHHLRMVDVEGKGQREPVMLGRFSAAQFMAFDKEKRPVYKLLTPEVRAPYSELREVDLNADGRTDWVANTGRVWLREASGRIAEKPSLELTMPAAGDWHYCGTGDFNGDRKPDIVLGSYGMQGRRLVNVYHNTGNAEAPFSVEPSVSFEIKASAPHIRDSAPIGDWNGDGIDDLIIGLAQDNHVRVYFGSPQGLSAERVETITLEFWLNHEHGLTLADFNGDGLLDLGCFGYTQTGVGLSGPLTPFVWLQRKTD